MNWRLTLMVVSLMLLADTPAWACACGGNWPSVKQAWQQAPFVFLGTVELADPDEDSNQMTFREQAVRIRVDEPYKGVSRGRMIELHQGANDCDAKFRTGQRFVFYLESGGTSGSWRVPWCTHALGNPEPGGDDLLFLRGLPNSANGTRLSGEVELYEDTATESFKRAGGIPSVGVKITGSNGFTQNTVTNGAGAYEVFGLRPGKYSVSIDVPKGFKIYFPVVSGSAPVEGDGAAVDLLKNGGSSVGFVLKADTHVTGQMFDAKGTPITGVCIDLEPVGGKGENSARNFDCTKTDGRFEMTMMTPGDYWLIARDEFQVGPLKSQSTLYYPGVRVRERASKVSIKAGNYIEHLDLRLPSLERRYKITGKLQFADHAPAANATVRFESPEHGYAEKTQTASDGSFGLSVIAGIEGQLSGRLPVFELFLRSCPDVKVGPRKAGLFRFIDASPVSLFIDSDHDGVKIELPSRSCSYLLPKPARSGGS
jgi:hypothetical protein